MKNVEEILEEFEGRMNAEVKRQEKIDMTEERDYRRMELLEKYTAKLLYRWDDQKFKEEYLNKLEKNWKKWKRDRQIDESKYLRGGEEKTEEENEKIGRRDWRVSPEEKP